MNEIKAVSMMLHGKQYWKVGEAIYLKSGDKLLPIDHFDENGKPVTAGCWSEETPNANGGMDCTVHVPCLRIAASSPKIA